MNTPRGSVSTISCLLKTTLLRVVALFVSTILPLGAAPVEPKDAATQEIEKAETRLRESERLFKSNPDSVGAKWNLSIYLENLADLLAKRGQPGDAEKVFNYYARSLSLREALNQSTLHKAARGAANVARDVSIALTKLGDFLSMRGLPGDGDKALGYLSRSREIMEPLLTASPVPEQITRDGALVFLKLGFCLVTRGQRGDADKAIGYFARSVELMEPLHKVNPRLEVNAQIISESLNQLGKSLVARGEPGDEDAALGHLRRSLEIRDALLAAKPDSTDAKRNLSLTLESIAFSSAARRDKGDMDKAIANYTRCMELKESLLKANPDSPEATREVAVVSGQLGALLARRGGPGQIENAFAHLTRSLELTDSLLKAKPASAQALRDSAIVLSAMGDFYANRGEPGDDASALDCFTRGLKLAETRLKANPGFTEATRAIAVSLLIKLGDALAKRGQPGDSEKALAYFTRCVEPGAALLKANPRSMEATRNLAVVHYKIAAAADQRGDSKASEKHARAAHDLLKTAINGGMTFDPEIVKLYEALKSQLHPVL